MTTEPGSTPSSPDRRNLRLLSTIALVLTVAWGVGWVWVGGSGAEELYLWIGAPVIAVMWVVIGWSSSRRDRRA